jgi:predicted DNA-binding transcriptional regulator AlpA
MKDYEMIIEFVLFAKKLEGDEPLKAEALLSAVIGYASGVLGIDKTKNLIFETVGAIKKSTNIVAKPKLSAEETAKLINRSRSFFYKNFERLIVEQDFPLPIAGEAKLSWSNQAVNDWLEEKNHV